MDVHEIKNQRNVSEFDCFISIFSMNLVFLLISMFLMGINRNEVDFLPSANDQFTGNVPPGVGKFLCI